MAGKAGNRCYVNVSTAGTGSPFTTTTAISGFQTLSGAGFNTGDIVEYAIQDGANYEDGWGVVSGATITRNVFDSSNAGAAINLSGSALCIITLTAQGAQAILAYTAQRLAGGL